MESKSEKNPRLESRPELGRTRTKALSFRAFEELHQNQPPTSYLETIMHLFKGNVGTGCYGMADAIMNGGIILGPIMTIIIALICVHVQHTLIRCAETVKDRVSLTKRPDFAETVELSFLTSSKQKWHKWGPIMKKICNSFICITQLGFCSVYFVFISRNLKNVLDYHGIEIEIHLMMLMVLAPIWLTTLVRKLKYIAIFSTIANFCMIVGIILTIGYAVQDLPDFSERKYVGSLTTLPLYFGTALFAFEGIALVLPLQNAMKKPKNFSKPLGVLNVGMVLVTVCFTLIGFIGYWKYGEFTEGSLTLNLPAGEIVAQIIMLMIALGVLMGFAIQFFVAIQIMFTSIQEKIAFADKRPVISEYIFRTLMLLVTFAVAEAVPNLSLLLSLIGSVCCVVIAFVLPVLSELVIRESEEKGIGWLCWTKSIIILIIAVCGFILGGALSLKRIVEEIMNSFE